MDPKRLAMIVVKEGRFIGKIDATELEEIMNDGFNGCLTLEDACNMHDVITQNGVITAALFMGTIDVHVGEAETCIICPIEPKTSYYTSYYQSVSNLHLATSSIKQ